MSGYLRNAAKHFLAISRLKHRVIPQDQGDTPGIEATAPVEGVQAGRIDDGGP